MTVISLPFNNLKKKRQGPFRGPSRALKYKKLRTVKPRKVKANIPPTLGAVVGERANQFVAECSDWVKEICPLNVKRWKDMPEGTTNRLYSKIMVYPLSTMYLKLWDKSKRHKDGKFDDEAEVKYKELKELHEKEVRDKGGDTLTIDEAYAKLLGYRSGYARGLGKGHPVLSKDGKKGRAELEANIEQLQNENNMMRAEFELHKAEAKEETTRIRTNA